MKYRQIENYVEIVNGLFQVERIQTVVDKEWFGGCTTLKPIPIEGKSLEATPNTRSRNTLTPSRDLYRAHTTYEGRDVILHTGTEGYRVFSETFQRELESERARLTSEAGITAPILFGTSGEITTTEEEMWHDIRNATTVVEDLPGVGGETILIDTAAIPNNMTPDEIIDIVRSAPSIFFGLGEESTIGRDPYQDTPNYNAMTEEQIINYLDEISNEE